MRIEVTQAPLDAFQLLAQYQQGFVDSLVGKLGASAHFVGTMRDFNEGDAVTSMYLEHYPGMSEQQLYEIALHTCSQWAIDELLMVHRVGRIQPGDVIVVIGVWSAHRAAALAACQFLIETLKAQAPFWKKEVLTSGRERWVKQNTPNV